MEIRSAITLYSGLRLTLDCEDDRDNEDEIIAGLIKAGEKIYKSGTKNRRIIK